MNPANAPQHYNQAGPGPRLSLALLLYYTAVVLLITLAPFRFAIPGDARILLAGGWFDGIANVLLFVPLGFLFRLTHPGSRWSSPARVGLVGMVLSGMIEAAQLFESERFTSLLDVLANATGAVAGAHLQHAVSRRIRMNARLVGRLSLELPLMGVVYLLIPLLWLGSLPVQDRPLRIVPLVFLGLFGGCLLAALQRYHFGPAGLLSVRGVAAIAVGWMLLGIFPALISHPVLAGCAVLMVAAITAGEAARLSSREPPDRRFEARTLRRAAPWFAAYLVAMIGAPLAKGVGKWTWWIGFSGRAEALNTLEQIYQLESLAALAVLGYLLAEARGRRELPFQAVIPRLALECALAATLLEAVRGFHGAWGASAAQLLLLVGSGLLGSWIYHLQREQVRMLSAHEPIPVTPVRSAIGAAAGAPCTPTI